MQITFNLRPALVDELALEFDYDKNKQVDETKEDFVGRFTKKMVKQLCLRRAVRLAQAQAQQTFIAQDD